MVYSVVVIVVVVVMVVVVFLVVLLGCMLAADFAHWWRLLDKFAIFRQANCPTIACWLVQMPRMVLQLLQTRRRRRMNSSGAWRD